MISTKAMLGE